MLFTSFLLLYTTHVKHMLSYEIVSWNIFVYKSHVSAYTLCYNDACMKRQAQNFNKMYQGYKLTGLEN